jgi:hypothetical protein
MRRKLLSIAVGTAMAVAGWFVGPWLVLLSAGPASASPATVCANASYSSTTLAGAVVVPSGDWCHLSAVTVVGGVTVQSGALLSSDSSKVSGGLAINDGAFSGNDNSIDGGWVFDNETGSWGNPYPCGNNVNGGLKVTGIDTGVTLSFGEADAGCAGGTINGAVNVSNDPSATLEIDGYRINGSLTWSDNTNGFDEIEGAHVSAPPPLTRAWVTRAPAALVVVQTPVLSKGLA